MTTDAADPYSVRSFLIELDGVEASHDVGVGVALALDLLEQLRGHRSH